MLNVTQEEVLKRIGDAKERHETMLDLSFLQLPSLPPEIGELTELKSLDLSHNRLTALPPEISRLESLEILLIFNNAFTELPIEIVELKSLRRLLAYDNQLTGLPPQISRLRNLERLDLANNRLTNVPAEITQLTNLQFLHLGDNKLMTFPSGLLDLKNLQQLFLFGNQLTNVPKEISQLDALRILDLHNNKLSELPKQLAELKDLYKLNLQGNPFQIEILPEVLADISNPQRFFDFYSEIWSGKTRPLNEGKVVVIGNEEVGKSSLVERLVHGTFAVDRDRTPGIDVQRWNNVRVKDQDVRLNVWDFGGQEIMHATHRFFFTERTLYLIVLDLSRGGDGSEDKYWLQTTEVNRLEYWLKTIEGLAKDSPVIIVGNKIDIAATAMGRNRVDVGLDKLRTKYPKSNIRGCFDISCDVSKTTFDEKFEHFRQALINEVSFMSEVFYPFPLSWFMVKEQLERMREEKTPYVSYERYRELCERAGITDGKEKTLLQILNDLGSILNSHKSLHTMSTKVLNPEWVTRGVYAIIKSDTLIHNDGILSLEMLDDILNKREFEGAYPPDKQIFIVDMMREFELCFDIEFGRLFLVPGSLPEKEHYTGEWVNALKFEYQYEIFFNNVIGRFIVRMHRDICDRTYWRHGVLLKRGGDKALVRADSEARKIFVYVRGEMSTLREFLKRICEIFDEIHADFDLGVKKKIWIRTDAVVDYDELLRSEEHGAITITAEGSEERIPIKDWLINHGEALPNDGTKRQVDDELSQCEEEVRALRAQLKQLKDEAQSKADRNRFIWLRVLLPLLLVMIFDSGLLVAARKYVKIDIIVALICLTVLAWAGLVDRQGSRSKAVNEWRLYMKYHRARKWVLGLIAALLIGSMGNALWERIRTLMANQ